MGITIHYGLKAKRAKTPDQAVNLVNRMHDLATALPFESVGKVMVLTGPECEPGDDPEAPYRWLKIQAQDGFKLPWNKTHYIRVTPTDLIAFEVDPGPGSEPMNIGLCKYPSEVTYKYIAEDDRRFQIRRKGAFRAEFNWRKADKYAKSIGRKHAWDLEEDRTFKTRLGPWQWCSFCKTEYASDPACGGIANFLRCHIAAVTFLEKVDTIPGVDCSLTDEADYGRNFSCPDWREADAEKRERVYDYYEGHHDPARLAQAAGESSARIAAFFGAINDAMPPDFKGVSPIAGYANFEQLEFQGHQDPDLRPFLDAMAAIASTNREVTA